VGGLETSGSGHVRNSQEVVGGLAGARREQCTRRVGAGRVGRREEQTRKGDLRLGFDDGNRGQRHARRAGRRRHCHRRRRGQEYDICVPYFAKGIEHRYEIKDGATVVDTFAYVVPAADGAKETVTTDKGLRIEITTDRKAGVNGSPSKGCFKYKPPRVKSSKKKK
jgi:hypothetical protein